MYIYIYVHSFKNSKQQQKGQKEGKWKSHQKGKWNSHRDLKKENGIVIETSLLRRFAAFRITEQIRIGI